MHINLSDPLTQVFIIATLESALTIVVLAIAVTRTKKQQSIAKTKNPPLTKPQTNFPAPIEQIQQQKSEKEALRHEPRKRKCKSSGTVAYALLLSGTIALVTSIVYSSSILAFIGLGLTFWGALLLFIKPTKYVKASLLDSTALSSLKTIDRIITDLGYRGKGICLPPKYLRGLKGGTVFTPSKKDFVIPPVEEVAEGKVFLKNPQGICLTPPGLDLANLYENELRKDFAKVDLNYLQNNLPKLFIKDLEITEDLEINIEGNVIQVKITGSIYKDLCKEAKKLPNICGSLGCPLCSSIACALTRTTGKPVIIEKIIHSKDDKTIQAHYRILGTIKKVSAPFKPTGRHLGYLLSSLVGLVLAAFGSVTLAWVGWLTWYDITTWSKSLALIFFGARAGEAISLGIGMKVIYYFLIGSALLLSGLLTFLRRRRSKAIELHLSRLLPNLASLFLTAFGSIILAWVGWLTWYDMTTWGKDIALIFFGSRTGEVISLGIGMKVIHYPLIGSVLFLSGIFTFLRKRRCARVEE